jgi:hypothetical protein
MVASWIGGGLGQSGETRTVPLRKLSKLFEGAVAVEL